MTGTRSLVSSVLGGRYRVEDILGEGGMGTILVATHVDLGERVAIKVLRDDDLGPSSIDPEARLSASNDPVWTARFRREACISARVRSDHIVRVHDYGNDAGITYLVMELLEGQDLAALLEKSGPLSIEDAVSYALQACEGLAAVHSIGVVHRDIKPSNLFLTQRTDGSDCVKILDFGIAKVPTGMLARDRVPLTAQGGLGSPPYMPPEQLTAPDRVDGRADIWCLGASLYQLLTGKTAFDDDSLEMTLRRILTEDAPFVRDTRAVPDALDDVVRKCLEKEESNRFADVGELAWALAAFLPGSTEVAARVERILGRAPRGFLALEPRGSGTLRGFSALPSSSTPPPVSSRESAPTLAASIPPPARSSQPDLPKQTVRMARSASAPPVARRSYPARGETAPSLLPSARTEPPSTRAGQLAALPFVATASSNIATPAPLAVKVAASPSSAPPVESSRRRSWARWISAATLGLLAIVVIARAATGPRSSGATPEPTSRAATEPQADRSLAQATSEAGDRAPEVATVRNLPSPTAAASVPASASGATKTKHQSAGSEKPASPPPPPTKTSADGSHLFEDRK